MAEMIHVTVMLVGRAAELAGEPLLEYALTPPAALSTVLELMALRRPLLGELLPACKLDVNGGAAAAATALSDGDEVTVCPCD